MVVRTEQIYEALFDDAAFARLPDLLAEAGNARSAVLQWRHRDGCSQVMAFNYFTEAFMADYAAQWAVSDPWVVGSFKAAPLNEMFLCDRYVSPAAYRSSVFFNDFIRAQNDDTFHCSGVLLSTPWGQGVIGMHRGRTGKAFEAEDAARLGTVAVHIERVLRARSEIASVRRAASFAQGALDVAGLAAITVRADGRILHSNAAAEVVLRRADGLSARDRFLRATPHDAAKRLAGTIARATAAFEPMASAAVVPRGADKPAYLLTVTPLVGRVGESAALVLLRDPAVEDASLAGHLRSLFNLTGAEAAVAADLADGLSFAAIARHRRVRISTLRAQFRAIGHKTGCRRQSELVALIRSLPPSGGHTPFGG